MLGTVPAIGAEIPHAFPALTDYADPMAAAMTPLLSAYWDEAGKTTRERLGLDPDAWQVTDPHLHEAIVRQADDFCASTLATTTKSVEDAYASLRQELLTGVLTEGESIPELTKRVRSVFTGLKKNHAAMIARTETSRAVHAASEMSAQESGVVSGKVWLLSSNACPLCHALEAASKATPVPLGGEFGNVGSNPTYASIRMPPGHPHCRCSVTYALTPEFQRLVDANPPATFQPGPLGPEPRAETAVKPVEPPVHGATPEIRAAYEKQRAENRKAAAANPVVREETEAPFAVKWYRKDIEGDHAEIGQIETALRDRRAEFEKFNAEWVRVNDKSQDWSMTKATRAKWAKKVEELRPKHDEYEQIFHYGPDRVTWLRKRIAKTEASLAEELAKVDLTREVRYAENLARHPNLIPPGPIADRIKAYHAGDAKVEAIKKVAGDFEVRDAELAIVRSGLNREIVAKMDRQAELLALGVNPDGTVPEGVSRQVDAIQKEIDAVSERREAVKAKQKALAADREAAVLKVIGVERGAAFPDVTLPDDFKGSDGPLHPVNGQNAGTVKAAKEWLTKVVTRGDTPEVALPIGQDFDRRAYCARTHIQIKVNEKTDVVVHEYGHAIEEHMKVGDDTALKRSLEFLRHRVGDETAVDLKEKFGAGDPGEMGRKDRFDEVFGPYSAYYTGKSYGQSATEILSMGLQQLYNDPVHFAKKDPEFLKYVLGMADGSLR